MSRQPLRVIRLSALARLVITDAKITIIQVILKLILCMSKQFNTFALVNR